MLKFHLSECTAALCCRFTTTPATFNGMCSSAWKQGVRRVNGFDERMRYGGLDRELYSLSDWYKTSVRSGIDLTK